MPINYGDVFYYNVFRDATPTFTGTDVPAFAVANAFDWRDFSLHQVQDTHTIEVTVTANRTISHLIVWTAASQSGATATLAYESAPSVFTTLSALNISAVGITLASFASVTVLSGRKVRVTFTGCGTAVYLRQLFAGTNMTLTAGEWVDKTPHALQSGFVVENVISMNGSIIARNIRRVEKSGAIDLEYVTESWVRSTWEPFVTHARRYPFFYRWNPSEYANDVIFAAADQITPPKNISPPPFMAVNMPFRGITS